MPWKRKLLNTDAITSHKLTIFLITNLQNKERIVSIPHLTALTWPTGALMFWFTYPPTSCIVPFLKLYYKNSKLLSALQTHQIHSHVTLVLLFSLIKMFFAWLPCLSHSEVTFPERPILTSLTWPFSSLRYTRSSWFHFYPNVYYSKTFFLIHVYDLSYILTCS